MGRSGSEGRDQSSPREPDVPRGDRPAPSSAEAGAPSYGWWDWQKDVNDLDASLRPLARAIARRVEGRADPEELALTLADGPDVGLRKSWEAVSCLHRTLDRCQGSAPPDQLSAARERLDEACGELWVAGVDAEMAAMREFVREVAHDLRSPLHSIIFLTDALFREEGGPLSRTQKRQVSVVHSAAAALLRMAKDLLDLSGQSEETAIDEVAEIPFSPIQVVDDLESLLEPVAHHHNASLDTALRHTESRVGDPQILNRVLLNLACNALEAVEENGTVRIRVAGDRDTLRAVVEDDSDDVDPEEIRELADPGSYYEVIRRLEGPNRGLGLVICGRMVRAADGELQVERTDSGWTRISVTLPFPVLEAKE